MAPVEDIFPEPIKTVKVINFQCTTAGIEITLGLPDYFNELSKYYSKDEFDAKKVAEAAIKQATEADNIKEYNQKTNAVTVLYNAASIVNQFQDSVYGCIADRANVQIIERTKDLRHKISEKFGCKQENPRP